MRLIPFVSALCVVALLYLLLIERPALLAFARGEGFEAAMAVAREDAPQDTQATQPAGPEDSGAPEQATSEEAPAEAPAEAGTQPSDTAPIRVIARHSTAQRLENAVILRGQTEASRSVELRTETSSVVTSAPRPRGSLVSQGDLLCELEPGTRATALDEAEARLAEARAGTPSARASIAEAEARLDEARINFNAADKLSSGGFASDTTVASRRAAVRAAEANLAAARAGLAGAEAAIRSAQAAVATATKDIERLQIHAPFDGILESDTAELGSYLQQGGLCATLYALDPILITGYLPETDVARARVGAMAGARLSASEREVTGAVTFLSRSADPTTRTFRVEVTVPNPDLSIRDGQTATLAISADGVMAHLLPQSALTLNDEGTLGLRTVGDDQRTRFVPVEVLRDTAQGVWVTGLPDRADVIIIGQEYIVAGVPVLPSFEPLEGSGQ